MLGFGGPHFLGGRGLKCRGLRSVSISLSPRHRRRRLLLGASAEVGRGTFSHTPKRTVRNPGSECRQSPAIGLGDDGVPGLPWSPLSSAGSPTPPHRLSVWGENNLRFAGGEAQAPVLLFCDDSVARFCDKQLPDAH